MSTHWRSWRLVAPGLVLLIAAVVVAISLTSGGARGSGNCRPAASRTSSSQPTAVGAAEAEAHSPTVGCLLRISAAVGV
jgi:hypothetical protein